MVTYHLFDKVLVPNRFNRIDNISPAHYDFLSERLPEKVKELIAAKAELPLLYQIDARNSNKIDIHEKSSPTYILCKIVCPEEMAKIIMLTASCRHKIWLNDSLVGGCQTPPLTLCSCLLQKGENILIIELPPSEDAEISLRMRISDYDKEWLPTLDSVLYGNYALNREHFTVLYNKCDFRTGRDSFEYLVIPHDCFHTDLSAGIAVKAVQPHPTKPEQRVSDLGRAEYYKKHTIDTQALEYGNVHLLNHIQLQLECRLTDGNTETLGVEHFYYDLKPARKHYIDMAVELLRKGDITWYDRLVLIYYIDDLTRNTGDIIHDYVSLVELRQAIEYIYEEGCNDCVRYEHGFRKIFYFSELDQTVRHYFIAVPDGYDPNKRYPLFLNLSIGDYSYDASYYYEYKNSPVLAADVSGRGVTMGSYIGEASIQEILSSIRSTFSVDSDRIYCTGNSNGAGATWNQAQNFPQMFAGVFPVSCNVNPKRMDNLRNLKIINVSSKDDPLYQDGFQNVNARLKRFADYTGLLYEKFNHQHIHFMRCKQQYIEEMLKVKRNPYPDSIHYITERNRYRTAYWLTISGIAFGKQTAKITADIIDNNIHVSCQNITGLTIRIPPQINRSRFSVIVNRTHCFDFVDYQDPELHLVKNRSFRLADAPPNQPLSRKGMGLLDVYLGPLFILVGNPEKKQLLEAAEAFAHPGCNGFDPRIYVDYPIRAVSGFSRECETNQIIIDCNAKHFYLEQLRRLCPITMEKDGFCYMGRQFHGDYCIMQVIPATENPDNSILYINCSRPDMLRKNLFTRKVIIPSYTYGIHPCLNNEGLIFYNHQYYGIREWGSDLLPVLDI